MKNKGGPVTLFLAMTALAVSLAYGDAYSTLLQRYEGQIKQQERQLRTLRKNLLEKEQEAKRWQKKAEASKAQWTDAGLAVEHARGIVRVHQERRTKTRVQAEAIEWSVLEHTSLGKATNKELLYWTTEVYKQQQTPRYFTEVGLMAFGSRAVIDPLVSLSQSTHLLAEKGQEQEATLRMEELRWQQEEHKQALALDRYRRQQQAFWLRWQEAQQRQQSLQDERSQLEQSAQALRVMLGEVREHRDHTMSYRSDTPRFRTALKALKGTLPWPVSGTITQNFGKQYSGRLQQVVVSNGIKVEAEPGKSVRTVQAGKVLFARPFQQYGQLVIIQHRHGLTSVYGELGQTQVKEGDVVATLDSIGTLGESRSFYFELRHEEEPINPLVWLSPRRTSELSSRRKYQ